MSEESNEASNGALAKVKKLLVCMPATVGSVGLTNTHRQGNLSSEVLEPEIKTWSVQKGGKRSLYKDRVRATNITKIVSSVVRTVQFLGRQFIKLASENLLLD